MSNEHIIYFIKDNKTILIDFKSSFFLFSSFLRNYYMSRLNINPT